MLENRLAELKKANEITAAGRGSFKFSTWRIRIIWCFRIANNLISKRTPIVDDVPPQVLRAFSLDWAALEAYKISRAIRLVRKENWVECIIGSGTSVIYVASSKLWRLTLLHNPIKVKTRRAKSLD